ncbi:Predicted arabinose efflux permease, MFS family [Marininema mesophilum]|uniref:Predicted arabinose efflux permease, MFS family n=1 Tax=Marininema mesophilum TaxID=1048340 RepID=A0A1H2T285_9BACL|nr:MFS transporter [Marininema mesophilum]SDW38056.1 Predicted arabinose efflux permease, MFS family [Marininema mesophilum]
MAVVLRWRLAGEFIQNMIFWCIFPFMALYLTQLMGASRAGLYLALSQVFAVVAGLIGGTLADRWGRKSVIKLTSLGFVVALVLFLLASGIHSVVLFWFAFTLLSLCNTLYIPASRAMVSDLISVEERNQVYARFYTTFNIAVISGPIIGSLLFFRYPMPFFAMALALGLVIVWISYVKTNETYRIQGETSKEKPRSFWAENLRAYRQVGKDPVLFLFILAGVFVAQAFMQLEILFPLMIKERLSLGSIGEWKIYANDFYSWMLALNGMLVVLFTNAMAKWMKSTPQKWVFVISSLLYGVAIITFAESYSYSIVMIGIFLFTWAELMIVSVQEGFVSEIAPEDRRGTYFAAAQLRFVLGRLIAPQFLLLLPLLSMKWTLLMVALFPLISGLLYGVMFSLWLRRKRVRVDEKLAG